MRRLQLNAAALRAQWGGAGASGVVGFKRGWVTPYAALHMANVIAKGDWLAGWPCLCFDSLWQVLDNGKAAHVLEKYALEVLFHYKCL